MTTRRKDKDLRFCRSLAWFRARNRDSAWSFLVDRGKVTEQQAVELRRMIRSQPAEFRLAMIDLAHDCLVLKKLKEYLPFNPGLGATTRVGLLNMAVMIAEVVYTEENEGRRWEALAKRPRKAVPTTTKPRRKVAEKAAAAAG